MMPGVWAGTRCRRCDAMAIKAILFNTQMVRAILDGRKTVTRRAVKFKKGWNPSWSGYIPDGTVLYGSNNVPAAKAPYRAGDILWVRETWTRSMAGTFMYRADDKAIMVGRWNPSIHMPREAARIFLRVTGVWTERLQHITPEQIDAEGCKEWAYSATTGEALPSGPSWFRIAWENTLKPADRLMYGWNANPYVWVIEFERISKEEAEINC